MLNSVLGTGYAWCELCVDQGRPGAGRGEASGHLPQDCLHQHALGDCLQLQVESISSDSSPFCPQREYGTGTLAFFPPSYEQFFGSGFFPDPDQNFFSESGSAKNPDPIRKNPDLNP